VIDAGDRPGRGGSSYCDITGPLDDRLMPTFIRGLTDAGRLEPGAGPAFYSEYINRTEPQHHGHEAMRATP